MELLFSNTEDVKKVVGWLYSSVNFEALRPELEIATEDVCNIISRAVYDKVYSTVSTDTEEGSQSGGEPAEGSTENVYVSLADYIRQPVALLSVLSYIKNSDISHESDGRKVKIDKESEKIPWQWQIDQDNQSMLDKANRAIDRIIEYLDNHITDIKEWANSDQRKDMKKLFVPSAAVFDEIIPIDRSRQFFIRVLPFIRKADASLRLLVPDYAALKAAMLTGVLTDPQKDIIDICREIVVYRTMAKAVRHLSAKILPHSIVQLFESERNTQKASQPATAELIRSLEINYNEDGRRAEKQLFTLLQKQAGVTTYSEPTDYTAEKFFSV